ILSTRWHGQRLTVKRRRTAFHPLANATRTWQPMETILAIATLLGGFAAVWFFWDKRRVISARRKIRAVGGVNPLSLRDEEFTFLLLNKNSLGKPYLPVNSTEETMCKFLTNSGVLIKHGGRYQLSRAGKLMLNL